MGSPTTTTHPLTTGDTWVSADWVLPVVGPPVAKATVVWNPLGCITHVGPTQTHSASVNLVNSVNLANKAGTHTLLTPGLVNTHTHLELTFPNTLAPSASGHFSDWLSAVMATVQQASLQPKAKAALHQRIKAGAQHALNTGTTCVNDITRCLETPAILSKVGLRGVVSWECFHPAWDVVDIEPLRLCFQQFQHAVAQASLLKAGLSPHSFYNVSPNALLALLKACKNHPPWLIHSHVAECTDELAWLKGQPNGFDALHATVRGSTFGPQPKEKDPIFLNWLNYLTQHGLLPSQHRWVLAHGAVFSPAEWAQMAQWQQQGLAIGISHCLQSNRWLHQQSIPSQQVQHALPLTGLLSLGSDSPLSSPNPSHCLDLRFEARALQGHHSLSAEALLHLATISGAHQLGLEDTIGRIATGYQADLVLWEVPKNIPCRTPQEAYEAWLHPETSVAGVWVNGFRCKI